MAFGFPAYHEESVRYRGVQRERLARATRDALDELGWSPRRDGRWRYIASVPMHFYAIFLIWGARFTVEIEDERLLVRSEGSTPIAWMDLGQHHDDVCKFLDRLEDVLGPEDRSRPQSSPGPLS